MNGSTSPAISPEQFHAAVDGDDWRVVFAGASAHFVTESFGQGAAFVGSIGRLANASAHPPLIDLRPDGVTITLRSSPVGELSAADAALAQWISATARETGLQADPGRVQTVQLTVDAAVGADVLPFWRAVLGYEAVGPPGAEPEDLVDPRGRGPSLWFQPMEPGRKGRNRLHVDVSVPPDQAEARIAAALAAGGRLVSADHAPAWWTLADAEGNEVDVATWQGRG